MECLGGEEGHLPPPLIIFLFKAHFLGMTDRKSLLDVWVVGKGPRHPSPVKRRLLQFT